jgi:hypothetical protein
MKKTNNNCISFVVTVTFLLLQLSSSIRVATAFSRGRIASSSSSSSLLLSSRYYRPVIIMPRATRRSTEKALSMAAAMKTEDVPLHNPTKENDDSTLLQDWIHHQDASYHHFSKTEATEIRQALLTWYRANRRKLPWRGDPPPYDGSTAGINNGKKIQPDAAQSSIESFGKTVKKEEQQATTSMIPVSGYGVWVSEIMLQQTRVEAVIPYWVKCKYQIPKRA